MDERVSSKLAAQLLVEATKDGYARGVADEKARIRTGVTGLPWEVAVSFGPIDCDYSCEEGPCGCSGVMRPEGWTTGLEDVLAVIDALKEGEPDVR